MEVVQTCLQAFTTGAIDNQYGEHTKFKEIFENATPAKEAWDIIEENHFIDDKLNKVQFKI